MELELDSNTVVIAALLITALIAQLRLVSRKLDVLIPALMERSRRRNRRDSGQPTPRRRESQPGPWDDDERTDVHYLVELERQKQLARRQRRPGERPPRPGTHHDRDD